MNKSNPFFKVLDAIFTYDVKRATAYMSPTFVISAQQKSWGNKSDPKANTIELCRT